VSRTLLLKLLYLAGLIVLGGLVLLVAMPMLGARAWHGVILLAVLLLLPGRIQGVFYRNLFRARRLLDADQPREALGHLHLFLAQLERQPWRKRLIWLAPIYTTSAEAMAWNNVGCAQLGGGSWKDAEEAFAKALALDSKYPLPHVNLAMVALLHNDRAEAARRLETARALGYRRTSIDRLVHQSQSLLARVEGRGKAGADQ
jgi:tetratricopeptide (TPR) repeat protein